MSEHENPLQGPSEASAKSADPKKVDDKAGSWLLAWWRGRSIFERLFRHLLALALWGYGFFQLFVMDLDAAVRGALPEGLRWIVDYKFLEFLLIAALVMNLFPRREFWRLFSYIALYPVTRLAFFSLIAAYVLFKLKSWPVVFTTMNVAISLVTSFKVNFLIYVSGLIATSIVLFAEIPSNIISAVIILGLVIVALIVRRFIGLFRPSPIFWAYSWTISLLLGYSRRKLLVDPTIRGLQVGEISADVIEKRYNNMVMALLGMEVCAFLVDKFQRYRSAGFAAINYVANYFVLLTIIIVLLSLVNFGLYRANAANFAISASAGFFDFFYYSFNAMFFQHISEIVPATTFPKLMSMFETLLAVVFGIMLFTLIFAVQKNVDEAEIGRAIEKLESERATMGQFVEEEFNMKLDKALEVMEGLKSRLSSVIGYLRAARS